MPGIFQPEQFIAATNMLIVDENLWHGMTPTRTAPHIRATC
jgi:hypothetical protein